MSIGQLRAGRPVDGDAPAVAAVPAPDEGDARRRSVQRWLVVGDLAVLVATMVIAQVARFGFSDKPQSVVGQLVVPYEVLGVVLALGWWLSLRGHRTRSLRILGHGTEEYRRVCAATFRAFAVFAIISLALKFDASRIYLGVALPLGLMGLLLVRGIGRQVLVRGYRAGEGLSRVLIVGGEASAVSLAEWFDRTVVAGHRAVGVWVPDTAVEPGTVLATRTRDLPVHGADVDLMEAVRRVGAGTVLITDTEHLGTEFIRTLTWRLASEKVELLLSPNVLDVANSRLELHDFAGMPLLHLREPQYVAASRVSKSLFDRVGALLLVTALAPVLLAVAVAVKVTSPGPVFYRQARIGRGGQQFAMIKFRSMRVDADTQLEALLAAEGRTLAELPKLVNDPRVTRIGALIRRFSIDELPQLFNVLRGEMSLVGPRPQRDFEVAQYDSVALRRLTVLPGMTGLWQVSGRSNLSYDEAIRLDVYYVENWSMVVDLLILWRTVRAVSTADGSY